MNVLVHNLSLQETSQQRPPSEDHIHLTDPSALHTKFFTLGKVMVILFLSPERAPSPPPGAAQVPGF